jgi:hypothetical protein
MRPDAGRADFLFSRRRDVDFTMEPRLDAAALNEHRRPRQRKGADGGAGSERVSG